METIKDKGEGESERSEEENDVRNHLFILTSSSAEESWQIIFCSYFVLLFVIRS